MSKDKESICVTVRVRPLSSKELQEDSRTCLRVDEDSNMISMMCEKEAKDFYFDSVCDKISQNQVFEKVGKKSTIYCMQGYNCTIFAYGQTGAGKTFTMMGVNPQSRDYFQQRGLIPRTLEHLFECIEKQISELGVDYIIKCSFVEIYNEQIIDLLGSNSSLNIREDLKKGVYIEGVTQEIISQSEEAMEILRKGSKGRHVGSTFYNETSSRSHSVFTMQIQSQKLSNGIKSTKSRHFHFIDLAGSERTKKSMGDRLKEGCSINKSLHVLSMVISSLAQVSEGKARHVNYRDSKLTFLLKDSLGGNSKTHLIANISPSSISSYETKSTLMFARKVKLIKVNKVSINQDASGNLQSLKSQIRRLRSQNLLLRNGNVTLPASISLESNQASMGTANNSKMVTVLQQYVDEELQKQTQMELQITKLQNKNSHLQKGIKHFSENQKQLRMVLAIYEDKIKKLKKAETMMYEKIEELSAGQKVEQIKQYYLTERQILLDEIEKFKQLSSSSSIVKNLLRELKVLKQNPDNCKEEQSLLAVLTKNSEFLIEIKNQIASFEPEMQEGKASKALIKENEELKSHVQQLSQRVQKYGLELAESKDKVDETENLLNEAISNQISLEKKLEQEEQAHVQMMIASKETQDKIRLQLQKAQEEIKNHISKQSSLELIVSQYQLQISQLTGELSRITEKKEFQKLNFQQKLQALTTQNIKLQENLKKRNEELQKFKNDYFNVKTESERMNKQMEAILGDASIRIQQLQELYTRAENQKSEVRTKLETQVSQLEENLNGYSKENEKIQKRNSELSQQIRGYQQQILKHQQEHLSLKQKFEQNIRSHHEEKLKWEQNHNDLIKVINQKKACDSETQSKLTQSQLTVINLNQKLAELTIHYKNATQNLSTLEIASSNKISELEEQISSRQKIIQQSTSEGEQNRRRIQVLSETEHSLRRQNKSLEEQIRYKQQENKKACQEIEKLKKKQKEGRILLNQSKNQTYSLKKNYQTEVQSLKEQIRSKEDEIIELSNQNTNLKIAHERSLSETQQKMEAEFEVFKQNQGSIKSAMEAHLINKERKITQLKTANETLEQQIKQKSSALQNLQQAFQQTEKKLASTQNSLQELERQSKQLEERYVKSQEVMNALESDHLRAVEEMENNFNEQSDSKNAEIEKLRRFLQETQAKLQQLSGVEEENNQIKSEIINRQQSFEELQNIRMVLIQDLESIRNNGQQVNNYAIQLQGQLKEKQAYICQLNENLRVTQESLSSQLSQKEKVIQKLDSALQSSHKELENWQKNLTILNKEKQQNSIQFQKILKEKHTEIQNLQVQRSAQQKQVQCLLNNIQQLKSELNRVVQNNTQLRQILDDKNRKLGQITQFLSFSMTPEELSKGQINVLSKLQDNFAHYQEKNKSLQLAVEQMDIHNKNISEENVRLNHIIHDLEKHLQNHKFEASKTIQRLHQSINLEAHQKSIIIQQLRQFSDQNALLHRDVNQLRILLQQKQGEVRNIQDHLFSIQKKAECDLNDLNERLIKVHQESSRQIHRLNELYEESKQKIDSLKSQNERITESQGHLRKNYDLKVTHLESQYKSKCELLNQCQNQLGSEREKGEQLHRFIDEQSYKINGLQQQRDRLSQQIQQIKLESEKRLKQSEKRCQIGAAQMNGLREQIKLIQDEASVWKQRMENLQNEVRLSNDRAEKFRIQYMKEKQSNKQFKLLLDNAHCQIESFKSEVIDKDKLYHQLLQKVSKNDIERKGLMTQDKKFNELLEKSRIQVNQTRKKYEDQIKINNLLKQQIEKKDVDVLIVKQRSQEYCKKQQLLIESIRSDYSKIETELKSTQNLLADSKKALKKVTLKNEELEEQIQKLNKQYSELEAHNQELKKDSLKTGMDERQMVYVNKLKQENTHLKRELERVSEQVITLNQEKLRFKSEFRQGKDLDLSSLELTKKVSEVKYLHKIIDDSINTLGIRDYTSKKPVAQCLKFGIMELQRQLAKYKAEVNQLTDQMSLKNQRLQILENQKFKSINMKDEQDTLTKMRNKISKASSTFESIRQSKEDDKLILQMKDSNKSNLWGLGRS